MGDGTGDKLTNGNTPVTVNDCNLRHGATDKSISRLRKAAYAIIALLVGNGLLQTTAILSASDAKAEVHRVEGRFEDKEIGRNRELERIYQQLDRIEQKVSRSP